MKNLKKQVVLLYTDCEYFGGSENIINNIFLSEKLNVNYEIIFIYNHSFLYSEKFKKLVINKFNIKVIPFYSLFFESRIFSMRQANFMPSMRRALILTNLIFKWSGLALFHEFLSMLIWRIRFKPSMMHFNNGGLPGARSMCGLAFFAKLLGIPVLMTINNTPVADFSLRRKFHDFFLKKSIRIFTCGSLATKNAISDLLHVNSVVIASIPNSIPFCQKAINLNKGDYFPAAEVQGVILAAAGAFSERKGFEFLIRAVSLIHKETPNFTLIIFGEGELEFKLKSLVMELKLDKMILFYGYKEKLLDYFRWIDLFVMPSTEFEDMPITLLSACASGKASIGTKIAGIPEVIEDGGSGILVEPRDVGELVDAIKCLVSDSSLREKFGRRAKELFYENHSFENFEIAYAKIYQECIGTAPVK